ncbi:MAG: hypothetical protein K9L57_11700, partial [Spirochaetaceae bacterium]|nr:hypothetical protein [Spirochaetaceae bacterium]
MNNTQREHLSSINSDYEELYGFKASSEYMESATRGLSENVVREISKMKNEPQWMLDFRLEALETFHRMPDPQWIDASVFS